MEHHSLQSADVIFAGLYSTRAQSSLAGLTQHTMGGATALAGSHSFGKSSLMLETGHVTKKSM